MDNMRASMKSIDVQEVHQFSESCIRYKRLHHQLIQRLIMPIQEYHFHISLRKTVWRIRKLAICHQSLADTAGKMEQT